MSKLRITYTPRPDATPESGKRALAEVYRFILQTHKLNKKGACPGAPDDVRKDQDAHTAKTILPRR